MTNTILQSYREVEQAMERFTFVLQEHVMMLRETEGPESEQLARMTRGYEAMRDSSMIFLSYAQFIAYGMPDSEDLSQDNLQG